MTNFEDMTAEEAQAEKDFDEAFSDDAGAPADDAASQEETDNPSQPDEFDEEDEGSDDAPKSAPDQEEPTAEDKKKPAKEMSLEERAHGYDSMFGRLEKERAEKARLENELNQLRSRQPDPVDEPAPARPAQPEEVGEFEIPDELKDDLATVEKEDPQLAALFKEDSTDGKRLRTVLEDFGADIAIIQASAVASTREVKQQGQAINQTINQSAVDAHNAAIEAEIPGYTDMISNPARAEEYRTFRDGLDKWVDEQPYSVGVSYAQALSKGTASEIVSVLQKFKAANGSSEDKAKKADADADAAIAVPSKPGPLPKSKGDKNDFDAGWDMED